MSDTSGAPAIDAGRFQIAAGRVVDYVAASERRRMLVVAVVPLLSWLVLELSANLGVLPLAAAGGFAVLLYSRVTAQETIAASASGTGLLSVFAGLFQLFQSVSGGSTEALVDTVARLSGWLLVGIGLLTLGVWLHRAEL